MTSGAAPERVTIAEAARLSALFAVSTEPVLAGIIFAVSVGNYGDPSTRALQFTEFLLGWPLWALLISGVALFALTVHRTLSNSWDFAKRGVIAAYLALAVATSASLLFVEVIGGQSGATGGFYMVIFYLLGFTVIGGPVLAGLLAALWKPRRFSVRRTRRSESERMHARRHLGYVLLFAGAAVCLGIVAGSALTSSFRSGLDGKCALDGPRPAEQSHAVLSDEPGSFSFWPLGRQCEWDRADGQGTVIATSGAWGTTAFAGISGLLALLGGGLVTGSSPNGKYTSVRRI